MARNSYTDRENLGLSYIREREKRRLNFNPIATKKERRHAEAGLPWERNVSLYSLWDEGIGRERAAEETQHFRTLIRIDIFANSLQARMCKAFCGFPRICAIRSDSRGELIESCGLCYYVTRSCVLKQCAA